MQTIENLAACLSDVTSVGISGHIRPDGDCVGSTLGLYAYIKKNYPQIQVDLYLQPISEKFHFLKYADKIQSTVDAEMVESTEYDLFILLDSSDKDRLGEFLPYFESAKRTLCVDHHISNTGFADDIVVVPTASSTCEVLYDLMDPELIDYDVAVALYLGIVHDSGVFKYSNTSAHTMMIAGSLMEKGIPFTKIIDDTFYSKSYVQNQILGRALLESVVFYDGKCIFSVMKKNIMKLYGITSKDLDGIVEQLRITKGVECAIFLYETEEYDYKVSLRSNEIVDVSKIATYFGGGGHIRAAGFNMKGSPHDIINNVSELIEKQIREADEV